jgi:hypothetical protein
MHAKVLNKKWKTAVLAVAILLATGLAGAQTTVNLTAQRSTSTLPDGKVVPMWGFFQTGSTVTGWAVGPTITAAPGSSLTINLTNNLPTPTSIVILGQLGGGLGQPVKVDSPVHAPLPMTTWPSNTPSTFTPPAQGQRTRSFGPEAAANGGTATYTWNSLNPGTYLYETGTQPSIQASMGLYGVLVVTAAPTTTPVAAGQAYPGAFQGATLANVPYDADATLLLSEIDAEQNAAVDALAASLCPTVGAPCSGSIDPNAYPPAVNYAPTYFLINGKSFDKTAPISVTTSSAVATSGNVLVRLANAGLHTHVPSIVNLGLSLIAEDGNVAPGLPKVQSEVLLPAGKTFDVLVRPTQTVAGTYDSKSYRLFDRALTLSAGNKPDAGIQAFLNIAGATLPAAVLPQAIDDPFVVPANSPAYSGNVLSNDIGIMSATLVSQPASGLVTLNSDGTFTYTPTSGSITAPVTFQYYGNQTTTLTATVTLAPATVGGAPIAVADAFSGNVATVIKINSPGVLANDTDPNGYVLKAKADPNQALPTGVTLNEDGSFTATGGVTSFNYVAVNAQGTSSSPVTVTLTYPTPSNLQVSVVDALSKQQLPADYRWTIEEDVTYHNPLDANTGTAPSTLALNFHKSNMPLIATGCVGTVSCGRDQTIGGNPVTLTPASLPSDVHLDPTKYYFLSILPGDGADNPGHSMGGAPISAGQTSVTVTLEPLPIPPAQMSVFVFEDNNPTNGDIDDPEPGLGGFQVILMDTAGKPGDVAGQVTYDVYNMPLTNALLGTPGCLGSTPAGTPVGMVITCPDLAPDGSANSLAGHALIKNIEPSRYDVLANPGAAREGAGEQWLQVSTLEGTLAQDAFTKPGEPTYFQEFGPPSFHAWIGFVNPAHVASVNASLHGTNTVKGTIVNLHMSRPIAETLFNGSRDPLSATTCYVGLNSNGGQGSNIAFGKCDDQGNFTLSNVPVGDYTMVVWDQWLDQIISYFAVSVPPASNNATIDVGTKSVFSWFTNVRTSTYVDNGSHLPPAKDSKNTGVAQVPVTVRMRDGSISNILTTDSDGSATFSELFPLFNWYVIESDTTRYKNTQTHVVVDGGGAPDTTGDYAGILTSHYPTGESSDRTDDASVLFEGLQGFIGQTQILEWGKAPYLAGENGGITGVVVYASTRGFDDPRYLPQNNWEPGIPRVKIRLYQEGTAADGSQTLKLVNEIFTNSWDDFVNSTGAYASKPQMQCPGQLPAGTDPAGTNPPQHDPYVNYTLGVGNEKKCYDGFHNWNQVQPAVYDGRYNLTTDSAGNPLPAGKYVVEVVPPVGYEVVKEEDKNILLGDSWVAAVTQQFGSVGNIFILPDQATVGGNLGLGQDNVQYPACVGDTRIVPDFVSLFPGSGQVAPFANATRALCNRKEVTVVDQMQADASFHLFTPAPIAAHATGLILDDAAAEINQYSPDFGEKFAVPYVPISIKDFNGVEISRMNADQWGTFNGLMPSTWDANVPNPSGYAPNNLVSCMNDPGPIPGPNGTPITDPNYNPMYSVFCYTLPYMPGLTTYMDTPVLPVAAFASGYNPVDCAYPDATPAILRVDGSGTGPYLPIAGGSLVIKALGDKQVPNKDFAGPSATTAPFNQRTILRHYGFGATQGKGKVTIGGVSIPVTSWSDASITVQVPANTKTGELSITADNGKSTVDAVTVTLEATAPKVVVPGQSIQIAIDAATPGDLIILDAGTYNELPIMWKPVRLQGVGATSVIINAAKFPNSKLDAWRSKVNTLFDIDPATGNQGNNALVDPLPGQEITGGIIRLEPSVLSTEEGPGITVLAKDLAVNNCGGTRNRPRTNNFRCWPSRVDGISVTGGDSGGGIYVNGYAHNLEISNNRVYGNAGGYNGGVRIGVPYLEALTLTDRQASFDYNSNVKIHHNSITTNGTVEPNAGAAGAGGGLSICTGTDNYLVNYNFICGNYAATDGAGIGHLGLSELGTISHNTVIFNQSYIQGSTANGGGIAVEGEPATGAGVSLGTGDITIDANLIQGNFAQSGHGGGIRLQQVNGNEINRGTLYKVTVTNNIIVDNVAGWSGGGISMVDTLNSAIVNNTIVNNDSTAIVGQLFSANPALGPTTTYPTPAGISTEPTSAALSAILGRTRLSNAQKVISNPQLENNIIWHNRSFYFDMSTGASRMCPSNQFNDATSHTCTPLPAQTSIGQCFDSNAKFWDLGVVGDQTPAVGANHLTPKTSILTVTTGYDVSNFAANPTLTAAYCNGSRANPGQQFEPGVPFLPPFQLAPGATLDEGGNFVDLRYGPLSPTGDYSIGSGSPAVDKSSSNAPNHDYFGNPRPMGTAADIGAVEVAQLTVSVAALNFGPQPVNTTSAAKTVTVTNAGSQAVAVTTLAISGTNASEFAQSNTCGNSIAANSTCTISVTFTPVAAGSRVASLKVNSATVSLTGTGVVPTATLTPGSLIFGTQAINTTGTAQQLRFTNTGTSPLTFTITLGGTNPTDFTQNGCGTTLAAGAFCTINVRFRPTTIGPLSATLSVSSAAGTQFANLSGTGAGQSATFGPSPFSFTTPLGSASAAQVATLTNTGSLPLTISSISLGGANALSFAQTNNCPATLAIGANCTVNVTFNPSAIRGVSATLIASLPSAGQKTITLNGTGTAPGATGVTPLSVTFGPQSLGTTSAASAAYIYNGGAASMTIGALTLSGGTPAYFRQTNNCGNRLAPGTSCQILITFTPGAYGTWTSSLVVTDGVGASGRQTVVLSGSSLRPAAVLAPGSITIAK